MESERMSSPEIAATHPATTSTSTPKSNTIQTRGRTSGVRKSVIPSLLVTVGRKSVTPVSSKSSTTSSSKGRRSTSVIIEEEKDDGVTPCTWLVKQDVQAQDERGNWYAARIIAVDDTKRRVHVHFNGWNARYDLQLPFSTRRIRVGDDNRSMSPDTSAGSTKNEGAHSYQVGDFVMCKWMSYPKQLPSKILEIGKIEGRDLKVVFEDGLDQWTCSTKVKPMTDQDFAKFHIRDKDTFGTKLIVVPRRHRTPEEPTVIGKRPSRLRDGRNHSGSTTRASSMTPSEPTRADSPSLSSARTSTDNLQSLRTPVSSRNVRSSSPNQMDDDSDLDGVDDDVMSVDQSIDHLEAEAKTAPIAPIVEESDSAEPPIADDSVAADDVNNEESDTKESVVKESVTSDTKESSSPTCIDLTNKSRDDDSDAPMIIGEISISRKSKKKAKKNNKKEMSNLSKEKSSRKSARHSSSKSREISPTTEEGETAKETKKSVSKKESNSGGDKTILERLMDEDKEPSPLPVSRDESIADTRSIEATEPEAYEGRPRRSSKPGSVSAGDNVTPEKETGTRTLRKRPRASAGAESTGPTSGTRQSKRLRSLEQQTPTIVGELTESVPAESPAKSSKPISTSTEPSPITVAISECSTSSSGPASTKTESKVDEKAIDDQIPTSPDTSKTTTDTTSATEADNSTLPVAPDAPVVKLINLDLTWQRYSKGKQDWLKREGELMYCVACRHYAETNYERTMLPLIKGCPIVNVHEIRIHENLNTHERKLNAYFEDVLNKPAPLPVSSPIELISPGSSTGRRRSSAASLTSTGREYTCPITACAKSYRTEAHLQAHYRLVHTEGQGTTPKSGSLRSGSRKRQRMESTMSTATDISVASDVTINDLVTSPALPTDARDVDENQMTDGQTGDRRLTDSRLSDKQSDHDRQSESRQSSVSTTSSSESIVRCICSDTEDDGFMIQCEQCETWQHGECVNVQPALMPKPYFCRECKLKRAVRREHKCTGADLEWLYLKEGVMPSVVDVGDENKNVNDKQLALAANHLIEQVLEVTACLRSVRVRLNIHQNTKDGCLDNELLAAHPVLATMTSSNVNDSGSDGGNRTMRERLGDEITTVHTALEQRLMHLQAQVQELEQRTASCQLSTSTATTTNHARTAVNQPPVGKRLPTLMGNMGQLANDMGKMRKCVELATSEPVDPVIDVVQQVHRGVEAVNTSLR